MTWGTIELGRVARIASGCVFPPEYQGVLGERYPFFKVGDTNGVNNQRGLVDAAHTVSEETALILRAKPLPVGAVVFPRRVGAKVSIHRKRLIVKPSLVDNHLLAVIPGDLVAPRFLYYWLVKFDLMSLASRGQVSTIRKLDLEKLAFPLAPLSEQHRVVEILDQADRLRRLRADADKLSRRLGKIGKSVDGFSCSSSRLNALFQTLLYRAFTGELTVGWREGHIAELLEEMERQTKELNLTEVVS